MFSLAGLATAVWHVLAIGRSVRDGRHLAGQAQRFESRPLHAHARVLLLGDSTGVGVGAAFGTRSLSGLLAAEFPQVEIFNACINGARVADMQGQWQQHASRAENTFDLVLVMAGGNDVLRLTRVDLLLNQTRALLRELGPHARHVVWLGSADMGIAPALMPPLNWGFGWLCRRAMKKLQGCVEQEGADFIDFSSSRHSEVFQGQPGLYFASDGLHPSAESYRHCFMELQRCAPLAALLGRTKPIAENM